MSKPAKLYAQLQEIRLRIREQAKVVEKEYARRLGQRIRDMRKKRNLTQLALAELMGTGQAVTAALETGSRGTPSVSTLLRVAEALDCDLVIELRPRPE